MTSNTVFCGTRFYRFIDGELEQIRIRAIHPKKGTIKYSIEGSDDLKPISYEFLCENYKKLKPDAAMILSIVRIGVSKDVIVALSKDASQVYAICRQSILDVFSNIVNTTENELFVGVSISRDTCPPNIDFDAITQCDEVVYSMPVSLYIDDTLDSIMKLLDANSKKRFSIAMEECATKMQEIYPAFKLHGLTHSVGELLEIHNFMYDFRRLFNIIEIPYEIGDDNELDTRNTIFLEKELNITIDKTYVVPYSKEIDFAKIRRDYILISSIEEGFRKVYVCAYDKLDKMG